MDSKNNGVIKNGVIKKGHGGGTRDITAVAMEASWKGQCCGQEKGADGLEKNNFLKGHPRAAWGIGTDEQMFKNKKWRY